MKYIKTFNEASKFQEEISKLNKQFISDKYDIMESNMKYLKTYESLNYGKELENFLFKLEKEYKDKIEHCLVAISDNYDLKFRMISNDKFDYVIKLNDIKDCDQNELIECLESSVFRLNNELDAECYINMTLNHQYRTIVDIETTTEDPISIKEIVYEIFEEYNSYINTTNYISSNVKEVQLIINLDII